MRGHLKRIVSSATAGLGFLGYLLGVSVSAQPSAWRPVGPAPPAVITPVVVGSPGSGLIYIATFGGGVLKSTDTGRSFSTANNGLTVLTVTSMAAHPTDVRHLYIGIFGAGLFHTMDGGESWTPLATTPAPPTTIAIDPARPSTMYLGLLAGPRLRKSADGGVTWTDANVGLPNAPVWSIQIDPDDPDVLFVGTGGGGAFKSIDGGVTWSRLTLPSYVSAVAIDPRDSQTVYGGTDEGVYRSVDAGASFARAGSPGSGRVLSLILDPRRRGVVYAGTLEDGVQVSADFGETFRRTGLSRGTALVLSSDDAGVVYVGTGSSGVMKTGSFGLLWSPVAAELLNSINGQNVYGLTVDPQNSARVLAATNFAGMLETPNGGRTWRESYAGYTSHTARTAVFDPADATRVYAGSLNGGGLLVSADRGRTWTQRAFGSPAVYVWAVSVGPDRSVYAATAGEGLWWSTDLGTSFNRVPNTPFSDVRGVAIDPGNSRHLLVASNQGLFRSVDGGENWSRLLTTAVGNVVFDARNPQLVYASTSANGVQRSTDRGASFLPSNTGLTALVTSRGAGVVIDPRNSQVLYLGTENGGVFKSTNGGATWLAINDGLSDLRVFALAIDPRNPDTLYAAGSSSVFKTTTGGEPGTR